MGEIAVLFRQLQKSRNSMAGIRQDNGSQRVTAGTLLPGVIGSSPAMQDVFRITRRVAEQRIRTAFGRNRFRQGGNRQRDTPTKRSKQRSVCQSELRCLSESLLESELFGHVRGAFTGAVSNRAGRFEAAHSGTIFLDEINSTSMHLQVKLLRVLQQKQFERVGDTETVSVDTRVIAASNRDLAEEIKHERFREDLYWRLNVVPIEIPPLRKRREDIQRSSGTFCRSIVL